MPVILKEHHLAKTKTSLNLGLLVIKNCPEVDRFNSHLGAYSFKIIVIYLISAPNGS